LGWKSLCSDDPLVTALQTTYKAIPLRVPATNVRPLQVLRNDGERTDRLGSLADALEGTATLEVPLQTAQVAAALGHSSRKVNLSLGLDILGPYLRAFGLSTVGLEGAFEGASQVSFSFASVERTYVDALALGKAIRGKKIDTSNPALADFTDPDTPWGFYVIEGILTSPQISVQVESTNDASFKLNVPAIQALLGSVKAGVEVSASDGRELSVAGTVPLTFAFSVIRFYLTDGAITSVAPGDTIESFGFTGSPDDDAPKRVLLSAAPAMLTWDADGE